MITRVSVWLSLVTSICLVLATSALAADRNLTPTRKAVTRESFDDGLYVATRPEKYVGKQVHLSCDRIQDADNHLVTCRSGAVSIFVETKNLDDDVLQSLFRNCDGRLSSCRGNVTGVVDYVRGVPRLSRASLELFDD
jgi:hypothetical protein